MAEGGLSGGTEQDAAATETIEGVLTPQGEMIPEAPLEQPAEEAQETEPEWLAGIDDPKTREQLESKGFKSPADVARAYAELERANGAKSNEVGELRAMLEEALAKGGQTAPQTPAAQDELLGYDAVVNYAQDITRRIDSGEVEPGQGIAAVVQAMADVAAQRETARDQAFLAHLEERLGAATAPISDFQTQQQMGGVIAEMKTKYGTDVYNRFAADAAEKIKEWGRRDPAFARTPGAIRTAFNEVAAEAFVSSQRAAESTTLDGNGPGPAARGIDPADAIIQGIEAAIGNGGGGGFS